MPRDELQLYPQAVQNRGPAATAPRVVEIVGPAGAGKTTLCHALSSSSHGVRLGNFPDIRQISAAPFFVWNGLQILPAILRSSQRNTKGLSRREFAWLSILNGWPGILDQQTKDGATLVLDQGPVYLLTETREFGPEALRRQESERLWQVLYSRWAGSLDMIVWLDAPDAELTKRIRSRTKEHAVKNESREAAFEFLARFRGAYERTISRLVAADPDLEILRFDTSQRTPGEVANLLLLRFGLVH